MNDKNIVQACYGKMQVPNGPSAQLYIFGIGSKGSKTLDKADGVSPLTKPVVTSSLSAYKYEIVGLINSNNFIIEDNIFIAIKGQRSYDLTRSGGIMNTADLYIRTHRNAPYYSITMDLPSHPNAMYQKMRFVGRFDILTLEEIEEYKLVPQGGAAAIKLRQQTEASIGRVFDITKISEAIVEKQTIRKDDDGKVIVSDNRLITLD